MTNIFFCYFKSLLLLGIVSFVPIVWSSILLWLWTWHWYIIEVYVWHTLCVCLRNSQTNMDSVFITVKSKTVQLVTISAGQIVGLYQNSEKVKRSRGSAKRAIWSQIFQSPLSINPPGFSLAIFNIYDVFSPKLVYFRRSATRSKHLGFWAFSSQGRRIIV